MVEWKWAGTAPMVQGEWKIRGWTLKERLNKEKEEAELEGEQMVTIPPWDGEEEEEGRKNLGKGRRWKGRRGGQGPPPEIVKGRGRRRGPPPGREVRLGVSFSGCVLGFCFAFWYAGVPHYDGRIPLRRVTVRLGQDFGGGRRRRYQDVANAGQKVNSPGTLVRSRHQDRS